MINTTDFYNEIMESPDCLCDIAIILNDPQKFGVQRLSDSNSEEIKEWLQSLVGPEGAEVLFHWFRGFYQLIDSPYPADHKEYLRIYSGVVEILQMIENEKPEEKVKNLFTDLALATMTQVMEIESSHKVKV